MIRHVPRLNASGAEIVAVEPEIRGLTEMVFLYVHMPVDVRW